MIMNVLWLLIVVIGCFILIERRASLTVFLIGSAALLGCMSVLSTHLWPVYTVLWFGWGLLFVWSLSLIRLPFIMRPLLKYCRQLMPSMSDTERQALQAGTVWWDQALFSGRPDWNELLRMPEQNLTEQEQRFIDGPLKTLCWMIDDWEITHERADLPPNMWQFIKDNGFWGLIIPQAYGGLAFSAKAHLWILTHLYCKSVTVATTVAVPNSLGPAELLLTYGTQAQKDYYLPRLAKGEEIPCFALTSAEAGSDAASMPDYGEVVQQQVEGETVLGIRLNWAKRYITLGPVATVIGLAFKLYDPQHLIGDNDYIGITCALVPADLPGIERGSRHLPLNAVFQNGPIEGRDVFIPMEQVIGGQACVGHGWVMLMECLSAGRGISLPSSGVACTKVSAISSGAYARIRQQFGLAIGEFEGIQELLASSAGCAYQSYAATSLLAHAIDQGHKPAVLAGIVKYHTTELGRESLNYAMDIHGGKGICLGPNNHIGRGYQTGPISITVEGANVLTRNMIIFGQGAMRCHPYLLNIIKSTQLQDETQAITEFDRSIRGHIGFALSNFMRALWSGITHGRGIYAPKKRYYRQMQQLSRFSSIFASLSDITMLVVGAKLKRKERISARLADALSYLYLLSSVLMQYEYDGEPEQDQALVEWTCQDLMYKFQQAVWELLDNYPRPWLARVLKCCFFPWGARFKKPSDQLSQQVANITMTPGEARDRLARAGYFDHDGASILGLMEHALPKVIDAEPVHQKILKAAKHQVIKGHNRRQLAHAAFEAQAITQAEYDKWLEAEQLRERIIAVDEFTDEDLTRVHQ